MTEDYIIVRVSRKKNLLAGLALILFLLAFELFEDCAQYSLSSMLVQQIHARPNYTSFEISDQKRDAQENRDAIRLHILLHSALIVITSGCLLGVAFMGRSPKFGTKEVTQGTEN